MNAWHGRQLPPSSNRLVLEHQKRPLQMTAVYPTPSVLDGYKYKQYKPTAAVNPDQANSSKPSKMSPIIDIPLPSPSSKRTQNGRRTSYLSGTICASSISRTTASVDRRMATHRCSGELSGGRGWFRWLFDEEKRRKKRKRRPFRKVLCARTEGHVI